MKKINFILLFIILPIFLFAQDTTEQTKPRTTAVIIQELRDNIQSLQDLNDERAEIIGLKESKIAELNEKNAIVIEQLDLTIDDLSKANETIVEQNIKLKQQRKALAIVSSILGFFALLHFAILLLKAKWNITLPYWLNTIL